MSAPIPGATSTTSAPLEPNKRLSQPSTIGGYALAIAKALDHYGVDAERVFKVVGVPVAITNDPMFRLPVDTMTQLYRVCVDVTHDPYFGLSVARFIHISNLHALGYAMAASSTLLDFCKRVVRYFRLVSQTAEIVLEEGDRTVIMRLKLHAAVSGETEDAFLGFLILSMRQLHKASFNPIRAEFHHAMPTDGSAPYEKLFRSSVSFGNQDLALVFARDDLTQPLLGACPELAQYHDNIANEYLAKLDKNDVLALVRQKIIEFLPTGTCTRERVAQAICMSPTTLQIKLLKRDTSFQEVLDETRRELACSYVLRASGSITEIAFLLGFSDSSNFTRAFRRWTGLSPSTFRQQQGHSAPAA
ncbi:MAG: AraC family transcriptional regulator [bacterium]|nr:MAG: AraC family transcriptional regulator [Ralstonia sp.]